MSQTCGILHDGLRHVKRSLGSDTLGQYRGLGDIELQTSICLENSLKLRQNLKGYR